MNTHMMLDACGLEELDGATMVAVQGGLGGVSGLVYEFGKALLICIAESADSLIDGAKAGWVAAS